MANNEHEYEEPDAYAGDDPERLLRRKTSRDVLPRLMLEQALGKEIGELAASRSSCVIITAPTADWVAPLYKIASRAAEWDFAYCKTTPRKSRNPDDDGATAGVGQTLAKGGKALGVSHDPEGLLPSAMVSSADLHLRVPQPDVSVVAQTIDEVAGEYPLGLSSTEVAALSYDEITACIRRGSDARTCVERLKRAARGKATTDPLVQDAPDFNSLEGYGAAKQWGLDLIEDIAAWRRGEITLDQTDRMVLIASEPGLGKTTFARSLARTSGLPLIATSVGKWFADSPGYLDSVIKKIDEVFAAARANAPAIVLLDEIDALPSRATVSPRGADWWLPVITHMLTTLDGAEGRSKNLVVIAATNYPERLDSALTRKGRLSTKFTIPYPDRSALTGIFRQHLGSDLRDDDLESVALHALGHTGADVVDWIKSARATARRAGRALQFEDLRRVVVGSETRSDAELMRTAVHEAGHAVLMHLAGVEVVSVSIVQRSGSGGRTTIVPGDATTRADVEKRVILDLAGRAAEQVLLSAASTGAGGTIGSDLASATQWLGALHLSFGLGNTLVFRAALSDVVASLNRDPALAKQIGNELAALYAKAVALVELHRTKIEAVVEELLERRHLDADRLAELVEGR